MSQHKRPRTNPPPEVIFSQEALRRAWRSVRRNGPTPGTDKVTPDRFERDLKAELSRLRKEILSGAYQPQPVQRFYMRKASGKKRPGALWAIRDRVAQRVIVDTLTPLFERFFLDCSYGFRPGRSVPEATQAVIKGRDRNRRWVLDADIRECFDSIPVDLLMAQVRTVVRSRLAVKLIQKWLETPVVGEKNTLSGVSQGSVISPQLANLYLHRFDQMMQAALPETTLIRFADDFVVLCRRKQEARWSMDVARRSLENLRLQLNMSKTRVVHFNDGFTFLGVTFKGSWHSPLLGQSQQKKEKT